MIIKISILNKQKIILHSWLYIANTFASILKLLSINSNKVIWHVHNTDFNGSVSFVTRMCLMTNIILSRLACDKIIYVSSSSWKWHKKFFTSRNYIILKNAAKIFKKSSISRSKLNLIFASVGRYNEYKDYPNLFKALSLVNNEEILKNFKFIGVEVSNFRYCHELGPLGTGIYSQFEGHKDREYLYNSFDVLVIHSKSEAMPMTLIEALLTRKIIISTSVGDISSYLPNELIVSPQDPVSLSRKIKEVWLNLEKFEHLMKPYWEIAVDDFSINKYLERLVAIYDGL